MADFDDQLNLLMARYDAVNTRYIQIVAKQIKSIGELNATSMHQLLILADMNAGLAEVSAELAKALQVCIQSISEMYKEALQQVYYDPRFARALQEHDISDEAKQRLIQYTRAVAMQTAGSIANLSNTTLTSPAYRDAIDKAVLAVSSGLADYGSAVRDVLRTLGSQGLQVWYPSGYHRRLDTSVRQNVINGANQIAQNCSLMIGEELGYNAVELSAHARSAPDHEPVQGRVFLKLEFEKMQAGVPFMDVDGNRYEGFRRPIGEWNCMHIPMAFDTRYSRRVYSNAQLDEFARKNAAGCEINGRTVSLYQAGQMMREIETQVRWAKDTAIAAREAGDTALQNECQVRINRLVAKYAQISKASGIRMRKDRMSVTGFTMVKV